MRLLCALTCLVLQWDLHHAIRCQTTGCNVGISDGINVHLIPHTHDDVGWLNTVSGYFDTEVNSILDTVIEALNSTTSYRFTYVEMSFFHMWWNKQPGPVRQLVKSLVSSGRLGFALGGWTMADEATVYYADLIDDLTNGRNFLHRLFGSCILPSVAWQIDPFGHSRDAADIFIDAGYAAVVFQRIPFKEKQRRRGNKTLQFLWNTAIKEGASDHLLLAHVLYGDYSYPQGVCLRSDCSSYIGRSEDDRSRLDVFINLVKEWSSGYRTNHVMIPVGGDFSYRNAKLDFKVMDQYVGSLVDGAGTKLNVFYSTTDCYFEALNKAVVDSNNLDKRDGDLFPYDDREHNYWVGYYTSRPSFKEYVRVKSLLLTVSEQLNALFPGLENVSTVESLRQEMGIVQHHDAVAGTAKQRVTDDYVRRLEEASYPCEHLISKVISMLMKVDNEATAKWSFCNHRNISVCEATESSDGLHMHFYVTIYNPLGWNLTQQWLRIPLFMRSTETLRATVREVGSSEEVLSQLLPLSSRTAAIPERILTESPANTELVFSATIPPLGFRTFEVKYEPQVAPGTLNIPQSKLDYASVSDTFEFELGHTKNEVFILATHKTSQKKFIIKASLLYYLGEHENGEVSGAYVFRPRDNGQVHHFEQPTFEVLKGVCVKEIRMFYSAWATLFVRLYADGSLETEWTVGPIPKGDSFEVIARYTVEDAARNGEQFQGNGAFYTDSSGRRLIRRLRKNHNSEDFVASNYYPVINRILLKQSPANVSTEFPLFGFAVYTDRAQGGSSLREGQVELMLHRRLLVDDNLGVGEPLQEKGADGKGSVVRGCHRIHLDELPVLEERDRKRASKAVRYPLPLFKKSLGSLPQLQHPSWSGLTHPLPTHIHLLSLISWPLVSSSDESNQWLLRLENMKPSDAAAPTHLDVTNLFSNFMITKATEMILTADLPVGERARYNWLPKLDNETSAELKNVLHTGDRIVLALHPETIHTFIVHYKSV